MNTEAIIGTVVVIAVFGTAALGITSCTNTAQITNRQNAELRTKCLSQGGSVIPVSSGGSGFAADFACVVPARPAN